MESVNNSNLNRRAMLLGAVCLVGGAAALTRFVRRTSPDSSGAGPVLTAEQFLMLEQVTEVIIPSTDTPGALAAGVAAFMRDMLKDWGTQTTRDEIVAVLEAIEKQSWNRFGGAFLELPQERRLQVMRAVDAASIDVKDPCYRKFKYLVLLGYYQSEVGATQELRYELVPGAWRSNLPLSEVGRASAV